MADTAIEVLTIGHSTLPYERFIALLRQEAVTAVADVRSAPYSKHFPHFNRDVLRDELRQDKVAYVFLGEELGGRPTGERLFCDGVADYERMAETHEFANGLKRVLEGAKKYRIAMMCSEQDPLDCHRCLLVGRALQERGVTVRHILNSGKVINHRQIEDKLIEMSGKGATDLFETPMKRLSAAYRARAMKVAYTKKPDNKRKATVAE